MKKLSLKEFVSELTARLDRFTHDELKTVILEHAASLLPKKRQTYMDIFVLPVKPEPEKIQKAEGDLLLREIEAFGKRAANHEYTDGWGWDNEYGEERAWGDDSWAPEVDDLFEQIGEFYEAGDYGLARQAYENLLDIYNGGNEEGQFSGYDHDEMIETDIDEAALRYLRCIYLTEKPSSRPDALFDAISGLHYCHDNLNIHGMINVSLEELPGLDEFGKEWAAFLKRQIDSRIVSDLIKEGVRLFEGTKGLEILATESGQQFPGSFTAWLEALKKEKKYEEMIWAATLGLEKLPENLVIRARIADYLHEAAGKLKREDMVGRSLKEALYASPSLDRLLNFLDSAKNAEMKRALIDGALDRFHTIRKRESKSPQDLNRSPDHRENYVPGDLEMCCHLLKGDYFRVASLVAKSEPLGWSYGGNLNALAVSFFLYVRWNREKSLTANMAQLWQEATSFRTLSYNEREDCGSGDPGSRFQDYLENVLKEYTVSDRDRDKYFKDAEKTAQKRIDAIVGGKHRKSYWKTARLILAIAETYWSNNEQDKGQRLINQFREKYNRHSAFIRELRTMTDKSGLFSVR